MARVKDFRLEGTFLIIEYTDCTTKEINLCVECPQIPIEDDPGKWPDPVEVPDARCRVALYVGLAAANRLNDFLSGLNLNLYFLPTLMGYTAGKLAAYGWPIGLHDLLTGFAISLYTSPIAAGRGLDAKNDWDTSSTEDSTNSQEALYCALDESGQLAESQRAQWALNLTSTFTGDFEGVLADFVQIWPLDQLRQLAFTATTETDAVDCEAFDCGASPEPCEFEDTFTELFEGYVNGIWSTPIVNYGSPPRQSRNFSTGTCILQLSSPVCITKVRVAHAGQSGTAWNKIQLFIDDVPYPIQNTKYTGTCSVNDAATNFWLINPPISGSTIKFVGTDLNSGSTGNPNAPAVIHCVRVDYGV